MRHLRRAVPIVAVWLLAAGFFSWQHHQVAYTRGQTLEYGQRLFNAIAIMLIWALFTPPLLFVGKALPLRKPHLLRNALLVSTIAAAVALLRALIDVALSLTPTGYFASVTALFHTHVLFALIVLGVANFNRLEQEEQTRRHDEARSETEAAEAVLRQLRSDLNPHFLFNTINAVAMLLHSNPRGAEEMLVKLRDFLQRAVATEHAREVPLAEELEFVSRYLDIQKMRFGDKLSTFIHLAEPRLEAAAVPPLLLQPLIENSIVHGIARRRDGGCVGVTVEEQRGSGGDWLCIQVRDNGPGCAPEAVFAEGRIGVANAVSRLQSLYGARQSLNYRRSGDAFVAEVVIPLRMTTR